MAVLSNHHATQGESVDILILTALPQELDGIKAAFNGVSFHRIEYGNIAYYWGDVRTSQDVTYRVVLASAVSDRSMRFAGNAAAAYLTASALHRWNPTIVIFSGIGAGIQSKGMQPFTLGDVKVVSKVFYDASALVSDSKTLTVVREGDEPFIKDCDSDLLAKAVNVLRVGPNAPNDSAMPLAASDFVIKCEAGIKFVAGGDKRAQLIAMEEYGFTLCCWNLGKTRFIAFRAIVDLAKDKDQVKDAAHERAITNLGGTLVRFINSHPIDAIARSIVGLPANAVLDAPGLRPFTSSHRAFYSLVRPKSSDERNRVHPLVMALRASPAVNIDRRAILLSAASGIGKTSFVRAYLRPELENDVGAFKVVHHDAIASTSLSDSVDEELSSFSPTEKVPCLLLVIDQCEHWLSDSENNLKTKLAPFAKLDGRTKFAIFSVRAEYSDAAITALRSVGIRITDNNRFSLDALSVNEAKEVLYLLGRSYERLPQHRTDAVESFLKAATQIVTHKHTLTVLPIDLAILSLTLSHRKGTWTSNAVKKLSWDQLGTEYLQGVMSKLEAQVKVGRLIAIHILDQLTTTDDLKGARRAAVPRGDIVDRVGEIVGNVSEETIGNVISFLDTHYLLTPVSQAGSTGEHSSFPKGTYPLMLTHDYLVPWVRELVRDEMDKTAVGKARIALHRSMHSWTRKELPTQADWLMIRKHLNENDWKQCTEMVRNATSHYLTTFAEVVRRSTTSPAQVRVHLADYAEMDVLASELADELEPTPNSTPREIINIALALLPFGQMKADQVPRLLDNWEVILPIDLPDVLEHLEIYLTDDLKALMADGLAEQIAVHGKSNAGARLRAAAGLARFRHEAVEPHVQNVVDDLVETSASEIAHWVTLFRPLLTRLTRSLKELYQNKSRSETHRYIAYSLLVEFARGVKAEKEALLTELFLMAEAEHADIIIKEIEDVAFANFSRHSDHIVNTEDNQTLHLQTDSGMTTLTQPIVHDTKAKAMANQIMGRYLLSGEFNHLVDGLRYAEGETDLRVRSYLIDRIAKSGLPLEPIWGIAFDRTVHVTAQRAAILAAGGFVHRESLAPEDIANLTTIWNNNADAGIHSAAEWVLRRAGKVESIKRDPSGNISGPEWFTNSIGMTMVALPMGEFRKGAPGTERGNFEATNKDENDNARMPYPFAVGQCPVTWEQFLMSYLAEKDAENLYSTIKNDDSFDKVFIKFLDELPEDRDEIQLYKKIKCEEYGLEYFRSTPVIFVTWDLAAKYCNWLSDMCAVDKCYKQSPGINTDFGTFQYLREKRPNGYRLPSPDEFEYAARAGTTTARFYGESDELLDRYAWYAPNAENRTQPVGTLKPNDWGLFDILGNVSEWCRDLPEENDAKRPILRGGMYFDQWSDVRCAYGYPRTADSAMNFVGFRVVLPL